MTEFSRSALSPRLHNRAPLYVSADAWQALHEWAPQSDRTSRLHKDLQDEATLHNVRNIHTAFNVCSARMRYPVPIQAPDSAVASSAPAR